MIAALVVAAAIAISPAPTAPQVVTPASAAIQTGVQDSAYHGKFYRAQYESKRKCIVHRESNGHYFSTDHHGTPYFGAYQMTAPLAKGAGWMMQPELKKMFGSELGSQIAAELRRTPANKWNRFYQDMAFWTIADWKGPGSGLHHWNGGRWYC